jgi:hypothetical protein
MSGLNEQFTKLSTGLNLSEGSNPSRSAYINCKNSKIMYNTAYYENKKVFIKKVENNQKW